MANNGIISTLKKQISSLKDIIWDDNRMIAHYDNDIKNLKKRIKELEEENERLKNEISRPSIGNLYDGISR
jgi:predicted RNase H-like nuclease (RuvC/YqgF family)